MTSWKNGYRTDVVSFIIAFYDYIVISIYFYSSLLSHGKNCKNPCFSVKSFVILCEKIAKLLRHILFQILEIRPKLTPICLLYTSPSPRDGLLSRMPSSA